MMSRVDLAATVIGVVCALVLAVAALILVAEIASANDDEAARPPVALRGAGAPQSELVAAHARSPFIPYMTVHDATTERIAPGCAVCPRASALAHSDDHRETDPARHTRVVVSLTTIPQRFHLLHKPLLALLRQLPPDGCVVLVLPQTNMRGARNEYPAMPWLAALLGTGRLSVLHPARDDGPAAKILPVWDHVQRTDSRPERVVHVVTDDDRVQPRNWLSNLLQHVDARPECAWTYQGRMLHRKGGAFRALKPVTVLGLHSAPCEIVTGFSGFAFMHPLLPHAAITSYLADAPRAARLSDDVVISYFFAANGVPRRRAAWLAHGYQAAHLGPLCSTSARAIDALKDNSRFASYNETLHHLLERSERLQEPFFGFGDASRVQRRVEAAVQRGADAAEWRGRQAAARARALRMFYI